MRITRRRIKPQRKERGGVENENDAPSPLTSKKKTKKKANKEGESGGHGEQSTINFIF